MNLGLLRCLPQGLVAVIVCLAACSDRHQFDSEVGQRVAEHLCSIQHNCDCEQDRLIENCESTVEQEIARHERRAVERGLEFDTECFEAFLSRIDETASCVRLDDWFSPLGCSVYSGTADVGDPCEHYEIYVSVHARTTTSQV